MENVLKKIILKKKEKIQEYKKNNSTNKLLTSIKDISNFIDFKKEIKKRDQKKKFQLLQKLSKQAHQLEYL